MMQIRTDFYNNVQVKNFLIIGKKCYYLYLYRGYGMLSAFICCWDIFLSNFKNEIRLKKDPKVQKEVRIND